MEELKSPLREKKVLVAACCSTCSCAVLDALLKAAFHPTVFFYNPNIQPAAEYEKRKSDTRCYAQKRGVPFVEGEYDTDRWLEATQGLEREPERGRRCSLCFTLRLEKAATYARDHGFKVLTSSFALSRWKDYEQVTAAGHEAAGKVPGIAYWDHNWRKQGGSQRMSEIAKAENFYQQNYCGCIYSLENSRNHTVF
ncbi:MAG: epoxyqueuosine reductase QueH [Candidatus Omnitrophota bacterium]